MCVSSSHLNRTYLNVITIIVCYLNSLNNTNPHACPHVYIQGSANFSIKDQINILGFAVLSPLSQLLNYAPVMGSEATCQRIRVTVSWFLAHSLLTPIITKT